MVTWCSGSSKFRVPLLRRRRAHHERTSGDHHHVGTIILVLLLGRAFPEILVRIGLERLLGRRREHVRPHVCGQEGPVSPPPAPLRRDVRLLDPTDEADNDRRSTARKCRPQEPLAASRVRLGLPACGKVFAIRRLQVGGEVGPRREPRRRGQPIRRVREPCAVAVVRRPIAARPFDALQHGKQSGVFGEPSLQQAPLPQQRLVRRLDGGFARLFVDIGGEQPLLDEVLNQRPGFGGDFRKTGNAATRGAGVGIDAGEPGNEAAAKERQPRDAIPWDRGVGVGRLQRALDCRLDRAFHPTKGVVMRELESAASVVLAILIDP